MKNFEWERKKQGLTLQELAKKINVDVSTVQSWESGTKKMRPSGVKKLLDIGFSDKALIDPTGEVLLS